jgi:hypothetical protein
MAATYNQIHRYGTQAQYDALVTAGTVNQNYLYFTSDTHKLYKGSIDYTDSLISVNTVPEAGVAGKIYFETGTGQVKAYIGNAWEVISYPISQAINGANASTVAVPSEQAVVDYVESVVGDQSVVVDIDQKMNGSTAVAGTLVATMADASTFDIHMAGLATKPTWDDQTRQLVIPVTKTDGTTENVTVDIGKDIFLSSGYYDSDTKEIVLVLNDDPEDPTEIRVPASALYNDYTGGDTASASVSIDGTTHEITTAVNIDSAAGNAITIVSGEGGGLRVDLSAYATTASVDGIRSNLQGQIDATTATLSATTASLGTLTDNYNATTEALDTLTTNYWNLAGDFEDLQGIAYNTTATLSATTASLETLTTNYNATTAELAGLVNNYNNTTAALETLTTNYNATTVTVANNTADIAALATASTTWAGFADA